MSVTVIIVNFNGGQLLRKCLEHICRQTRPAEKILLVDNASTDGSQHCAENFPQVTLIKSSENLGFAGGNNLALRQCDTEFAALLNPDAIVPENWLEVLLDAAEEHPECGMFGSLQVTQANGEIVDGCGDSYSISGLSWRKGYGKTLSSEHQQQREIFSPCAAAALYRMDALRQCGFFDEDFFCYIEDVDLGFRMQLQGYQALHVPQAKVEHVGSATTGGQHSDFSLYHGHRNLMWCYVKNTPGALFWLCLPLHVFVTALSLIFFTLSGHGKILCKAKVDGLKGLGKMWKKRKTIQKSRKVPLSAIWKILDKHILPKK